jgi:amidohydrolase
MKKNRDNAKIIKMKKTLEEKINQFVAANIVSLLEQRRWFHQHPETSFKEFETSKYIQEYLKSIGIDRIEVVAGTGVVCYIGTGDYTTAARFNMDGLPIQEKNPISFCSLNSGYSHSCGHDFELAWGVMIAKYFQENKPENGMVKLIFQPAEEGPGEEPHGKTGGQILAELGVFNVDSIMSLHLEPEVDLGTVSIVAGEVTCTAFDFEIIIHGKTCHAAKPQQGINPDIYKLQDRIINAKSDDEEFILVTVSNISSRMDSVKLDVEETINTIPEFVVIKGISRIRSNKVKNKLYNGLDKISKKYKELQNCKLKINQVAVSTINSKDLTNNALLTANLNGWNVLSRRTTWRDDAGWASEKAPTFHGFVGIFDGVHTALHSPTFNPNEDALSIGLSMFLGTMTKNLIHHSK